MFKQIERELNCYQLNCPRTMYAWTVPWNLPFRCLDVCQILSSWACSHRSSIKAFTSEACNMALKQRWRKKEIKIQLKHKYKCNWNTNTKAIETQIHWNRGAERKRRKESDVCTMRKTLTMLHVLEISRWPCEDTGISSNWPIRLFLHRLGILWPPCNIGDLVHDELHRDLADARSHL